jgi:hypothetical protein
MDNNLNMYHMTIHMGDRTHMEEVPYFIPKTPKHKKKTNSHKRVKSNKRMKRVVSKKRGGSRK